MPTSSVAEADQSPCSIPCPRKTESPAPGRAGRDNRPATVGRGPVIPTGFPLENVCQQSVSQALSDAAAKGPKRRSSDHQGQPAGPPTKFPPRWMAIRSLLVWRGLAREAAELPATSKRKAASNGAAVSPVARPRWRLRVAASVNQIRRLPLRGSATGSALQRLTTEERPSLVHAQGADPESIGRPRTGRDSRADRPGLPRWACTRRSKGVKG